jgi:phosphatidylglycerophosphatase A
MKINILEKCLGSGFFTGYIPFASGTFGSFAALLIYYIPGFSNPYIMIPAIILFAVYGVFIGTKFEKLYGEDPAECTIDEVVGMWITLLFVPKTLIISLTGFLIWRILDIIKPFPARQAEKLHGGLGIMMDDVIAGLYSLIILLVILIIFKH